MVDYVVSSSPTVCAHFHIQKISSSLEVCCAPKKLLVGWISLPQVCSLVKSLNWSSHEEDHEKHFEKLFCWFQATILFSASEREVWELAKGWYNGVLGLCVQYLSCFPNNSVRPQQPYFPVIVTNCSLVFS